METTQSGAQPRRSGRRDDVDELSRLLEDVSRIAEGIGNINSLIVEMTPAPAAPRVRDPRPSDRDLLVDLTDRLTRAELARLEVVPLSTYELAHIVRALYRQRGA